MWYTCGSPNRPAHNAKFTSAGCARNAVSALVATETLDKEVRWSNIPGGMKAIPGCNSKMAKTRNKDLRTECVRGLGAGREQLRSRSGGWLCEDCPPAVRAVRLRTGATAPALGASEAPPHVMRKRLGCATRAASAAAEPRYHQRRRGMRQPVDNIGKTG
jgi:hypothetical protein